MFPDDPNTVFSVEEASSVLQDLEASISALESGCNVLRFELGGQLSDSNDIAARILVILKAGPGLLAVTTAVSPRWASAAPAM